MIVAPVCSAVPRCSRVVARSRLPEIERGPHDVDQTRGGQSGSRIVSHHDSEHVEANRRFGLNTVTATSPVGAAIGVDASAN
jgi:hypothetical protein